jgi:predicted protein tyrosine phosphatase
VQILVLPIRVFLRKLEEGSIRRSFAAILCSSAPFDEAALHSVGRRLTLEFDDVTSASAGRAFDTEKAFRIRSFFDSLGKDVDVLYVCCDYGESRSAAIAAVLRRYTNTDEMRIWRDPTYHPNLLIYKTLCGAFGLRIGRLGLLRRVRISRRAFRKAVKDAGKTG